MVLKSDPGPVFTRIDDHLGWDWIWLAAATCAAAARAAAEGRGDAGLL